MVAQYPENYLAIYDVPMDTDLNTLDHYPSVWIGKEEFRILMAIFNFGKPKDEALENKIQRLNQRDCYSKAKLTDLKARK